MGPAPPADRMAYRVSGNLHNLPIFTSLSKGWRRRIANDRESTGTPGPSESNGLTLLTA